MARFASATRLGASRLEGAASAPAERVEIKSKRGAIEIMMTR